MNDVKRCWSKYNTCICNVTEVKCLSLCVCINVSPVSITVAENKLLLTIVYSICQYFYKAINKFAVKNSLSEL